MFGKVVILLTLGVCLLGGAMKASEDKCAMLGNSCRVVMVSNESTPPIVDGVPVAAPLKPLSQVDIVKTINTGIQ